MTELDAHPSASDRAQRCPHPWCTTAHGDTVHPDDEAHRSDGVAVLVVVRGPGSTAHPVEAELGVLRYPDDHESWVVLETGAEPALAVTVESARRLRDALCSDPVLRRVLEHP